MPVERVPFKETGYFSDLISDYLDQKPSLQPFYGRFPVIENFEAQFLEKKKSFSQKNRLILSEVLKQQYRNLNPSEKTNQHIALLQKENTFTITTGHQLNLFSGPLYFLYKIISVINTTKLLKKEYPEFNFIPVFWMASEDHDFEEINHFNFKGKKIQWNQDRKGAVGKLNTGSLDQVFEVFSKELGIGERADELRLLFQEAYLQNDSLADATRSLANALFGSYGLVIVDGDHHDLKKIFIPFIKNELQNNTGQEQVLSQSKKLDALGYKVQVNPREINLFYLSDGLRERIIEKDGLFYVDKTELKWSGEEILKLVDETPERFSPNVIMRPLYQEVVLPNICYIGGGGELAYWLELKSYFSTLEVPFPIVLLRNSALILTSKKAKKLEKLALDTQDLFLDQHELTSKKIRQISAIPIDFEPQKRQLSRQFEELYILAEKTDASFLNAVKAQEVKQLNGLDTLEKRLLKAQKRKLKDHVQRLQDLQDDMFPNKNLQERVLNFSELYLEYGSELIPMLIQKLNPFEGKFLIITS